MQQSDAVALGPLTTPIVPRSRVRVAVAHQGLDCCQSDTGVEEIAGVRGVLPKHLTTSMRTHERWPEAELDQLDAEVLLQARTNERVA